MRRLAGSEERREMKSEGSPRHYADLLLRCTSRIATFHINIG